MTMKTMQHSIMCLAMLADCSQILPTSKRKFAIRIYIYIYIYFNLFNTMFYTISVA